MHIILLRVVMIRSFVKTQFNMFYYSVKPSLVKWGTFRNCANHGEILEHPGGIKPDLKQWNISNLSKIYPLKD